MIWRRPDLILPRRELLLPKRSFMPGLFPGGPSLGRVYRPASYDCSSATGIIGASDTERAVTDDPTTQAGFSVWCKGTDNALIFNSFGGTSTVRYLAAAFASLDINFYGDSDTTISGGSFEEITGAGEFLTDDSWHHYYIRYDSTEVTDDDRIQFYIDGSLIADSDGPTSGSGPPSLNEDCYAFSDKNLQLSYDSVNAKLAFIQIIQDTAPAVTDLAFDDGGTWTHKPYTGSYGPYGNFLDGSNGFIDSANGIDFSTYDGATGVSLDFADLPPYTN